ncbi:MAG: sigma-54 dependent transcriptional regulator [Pirellulales bacterium]
MIRPATRRCWNTLRLRATPTRCCNACATSIRRSPSSCWTTAPSIERATAALRGGAADYLPFPAGGVELGAALERVLRERRRDDENQLLRRQVERSYASFEDILGASPPMRKVFDTIDRVAGSNVDVLILGPTGTGKELIARAIHRRSPAHKKPFIPVDCGAIPDNLIESELFGHERGAFTGADSRRIGLLEFADGGTIFLDELGELPQAMQSKLLRTLQERKIRRVGGREEIDVDLRVVAATSRDLDAMIRNGQFREDLYYRVNVVRIELPPLRERGDDLGLLAEYFVHKHSKEMGKAVVGFLPEAYQVLKQYPWPGNVRELQNVVRRALAMTKGTKIGVDDLPDDVVTAAGSREGPTDGASGYFQLRDEHTAKFERGYLRELLQRHKGDVPAASREAKLPRGTLYRLLKNHSIDPETFR